MSPRSTFAILLVAVVVNPTVVGSEFSNPHSYRRQALTRGAVGSKNVLPSKPKLAATPEEAVKHYVAAVRAGDFAAARAQLAQPLRDWDQLFHLQLQFAETVRAADRIVDTAVESFFRLPRKEASRPPPEYSFYIASWFKFFEVEILGKERKGEHKLKLGVREIYYPIGFDFPLKVETHYVAVKEGESWKLVLLPYSFWGLVSPVGMLRADALFAEMRLLASKGELAYEQTFHSPQDLKNRLDVDDVVQLGLRNKDVPKLLEGLKAIVAKKENFVGAAESIAGKVRAGTFKSAGAANEAWSSAQRVAFAGKDDIKPASALTINATLQFTVDASDPPKRLTLTALVPQDRPGQQKIVNLKYSHEPARFVEEFGNKYAVFVLEPPKKKTIIKIDVEAELYSFDLKEIDKARLEKAEDLKSYLRHEPYLERDCEEIQEAAKVIQGKDDVDTLRGVLAFVVSMVKRGPYDRKDRGALYALQMKEGDWTEFADLFVALCRAKGIPARVCEGYLPDKDLKQPRYQWAEAYTEKTGWLSFDPYQVSAGKASFERMPPRLCLSTVRSDARIMYYHYWAYYYDGEGTVSVQSDYTVHGKGEP